MNSHQESAYSTYHEWKDWSEDSFGIVSTELKAVYSTLLRSHARLFQGVAIDFGFGNGEMLTTFGEFGFRVMGVERNPMLRNLASNKGYDIFENLNDVEIRSPEKISVITAFHVLEHLDRDALREILVKFSELLKPGGVVIAAFPNGDSPFSASAFNGDITHSTLIGSSMAEQLGMMSGLNLTAFKSFPPLTIYSPLLRTRIKGLIRLKAENLLNRVLSRIYFGSGDKVLSPIAVAVWAKE